jgi:DNA-binding NarL/FixJ family response regulator
MGKPRILVVEDEFIVAFELKVALEEMGYAVCGMVSSGEEAIDCAEREQPDCVLMDVSLKGEMDGIQAARHIRVRFGARIAFLSGYPAEEMMRRAADIQPIGFFVKPLEYKKLEMTLGDLFLSRGADVN